MGDRLPSPRRTPPSPPRCPKKESRPVCDISKLLNEYGFVPLTRYAVKDGKHESVWYIKAISPNGDIVLVELDDEGVVKCSEEDMLMSSCPDRPIVNESVKQGSFDLAGLESFGIAFVCTNGVCTLIHSDDTAEAIENNFTFLDGQEVPDEEEPTALPIVRLTEIKAATPEAVSSISNVAKRLQEQSRSECAKQTQQLADEMGRLQITFQHYVDAFNQAFDGVQDKITHWQRVRWTYQAQFPYVIQPQEQQAVTNIGHQNELNDLLMRTCQQINKHITDVRRLTETFENSRRIMERISDQ